VKNKRHIPSEIAAKLQQATAMLQLGVSISRICQTLGISRATYYRWKQHFGQMTGEQLERHFQLIRSMRQLRQSVAESTAEIQVLRSVISGNW